MSPAEQWQRLADYAARHMPAAAAFNPPASDADLDTLAGVVGPDLPAALVALLRIHDGGGPPVLPQGAWFRTAAETLTAFHELGALAEEHFEECPETLSADGTHVDAPFHPRWVPFATREDFDLFLDLAPGPNGVVGQVLFPISEASVVVLAPSLDDFLTRWTALLASDRLRFEPEYGYPLPVEGSDFEALFARPVT